MNRTSIIATCVLLCLSTVSCMGLKQSPAANAIDPVFMAIAEGDTNTLAHLLDSGLSANALIGGASAETKWRLLHFAVVQNQAEATKLLVARGASLDARDAFRKRAFDYAWEEGQTNLCNILRRAPTPEEKIAGVPVGVWGELFDRGQKMTVTGHPVFVSLNAADPPEDLIRWLSGRSAETRNSIRRLSQMERVSRERKMSEGLFSQYRDKITKKYGFLLELTIVAEPDSLYSFRKRRTMTESLGGGGVSGEVRKQYGYWILITKESWIE